jgi:hypothetical protein
MDPRAVSALIALLASEPARPSDCASCERFRSPRAAFEKVAAESPLLLAIGEYHQVEGGPKVQSTIKRFTTELLPVLKGRAGAMVVETWILSGTCGAVEKQVAKEVTRVTRRPKETEDEIEILLERSYGLGIQGHTLRVDCEEYRSMLDADGELDADRSMRLVRRKLEEKADEIRDEGEAGVEGKMLVIYGGAVHNDVEPTEEYREWSYGPALSRAVGEKRYIELDLLVPELVRGDPDLAKLPWFKPALAMAARGDTVLVSPKAGVRYLLFPSRKS